MTGKKKRTIILAIAAVLLALVVWTVCAFRFDD